MNKRILKVLLALVLIISSGFILTNYNNSMYGSNLDNIELFTSIVFITIGINLFFKNK